MSNLAVKNILYYDSALRTADADLATFANGSTENEITGINRTSRILFKIKNTAAAKAFVIKASDIGINRGQGDVSINLVQNGYYEFQIEAERFLNADGQIQFTVATGATGAISVTQLLD